MYYAGFNGMSDLGCDGDVACKKCAAKQSGMGGLGVALTIDPISAIVGGVGQVVGGFSSVWTAGKQAAMQTELLKAQRQQQKKQQQFEQQQALLQAEELRQQSIFGASRGTRTQEVLVLSVVGIAAVGVAAFLFYKSRQKG